MSLEDLNRRIGLKYAVKGSIVLCSEEQCRHFARCFRATVSPTIGTPVFDARKPSMTTTGGTPGYYTNIVQPTMMEGGASESLKCYRV
jgi:uncharacterized membrane protein (UPF0136 family)